MNFDFFKIVWDSIFRKLSNLAYQIDATFSCCFKRSVPTGKPLSQESTHRRSEKIFAFKMPTSYIYFIVVTSIILTLINSKSYLMLAERIKVIIADDHSPFRNALKKLFNRTEEVEVEVLGEAENGQQLVQLVEEKQPDIVISDIGMPVMNGIDATKIIKRKFPNVKVIAFSLFDDENHIDGMIDAGASGYLLKNINIEDIIAGITSVYQGATYFKTTMG